MRLHLWKTVSIITRQCIFEDEPATMVQTRPSGLSTVSFSDAPVEPSSFWLYAFPLSIVVRRALARPSKCRVSTNDPAGGFCTGSNSRSDRHVARNSPLRSADALRGLIELCRHVKELHDRLTAVDSIEADERVDFEVCEVEIGVDSVETGDEIDERLLLLPVSHVQEQG